MIMTTARDLGLIPFVAALALAAPAVCGESIDHQNFVNVHPQPTCDIRIAESDRFTFQKLDEMRIFATWLKPRLSGMVATEMRLACDKQPYFGHLANSGFHVQSGQWRNSSGTGNNGVDDLLTPTWRGKAATFYLVGNLCRIVVGEAFATGNVFFVEYCLPEFDHEKVTDQFTLIERQLVIN
jgi:hypothetical protein